MTVEEQYTAIRAQGFLADFRNALKTNHATLQTQGITVRDEMSFLVDGVTIVVRLGTDDADIKIGTSDDGSPLYTWKMPLAWF